MWVLALGIILWTGIHLSATLRVGVRDALITKLGENKYKGLFSLSLLVSIGIIVIGWRATDSIHVYDPPLWNSPLMILLVWIAFVLMAASAPANNIKRFVRHPQLTGVLVWAGAHLLANGDNRSLMLFGGLGLWALVEIFLISRRDGPWEKPEAVPFTRDLKIMLIATVVVVVLIMLHPFFTGMPIQMGS